MGDNIWLEDRNGVRTPMQWEPGANAGFSEASADALYAPPINDETFGPARVNAQSQSAEPDSLLNLIRHMIAIRKGHRAFGWGDFAWMDVGNESIAAFERIYQGERIFAIHNLSNAQQNVAIKKAVTSVTDLLTGEEFHPVNETIEIDLLPYQYLWLK